MPIREEATIPLAWVDKGYSISIDTINS